MLSSINDSLIQLETFLKTSLKLNKTKTKDNNRNRNRNGNRNRNRNRNRNKKTKGTKIKKFKQHYEEQACPTKTPI